MLNFADNKIASFNIDLLKQAADLRAFRNKFVKYFIANGSLLNIEEQSALLIYFALSFIDQKVGVAKLFGLNRHKKLSELTAKELFYLGNQFFVLLGQFLPENLGRLMPQPEFVSWHKAQEFFERQTNDILFSEIANLGFAFQIFGSVSRKRNALPALQRANKKISKEELIAFTQLYTPSWVVDFLIANTVLQKYNGEKISRRYRCWLLPNLSNNEAQIKLPAFSLIDPACGAGQFLFSAFDLFSELYEQEGYQKELAAKIILSKNIFAADIDEKALWVAGLGLLTKYLVFCNSIDSMPARFNNLIFVSAKDIADEMDESSFLGSIDNRLSAKHFLKNQYAAIVTNPPYIGRRCLSREIKSVLKQQYPNSSTDLSAAFLERSLAMLRPEGRLGIITQSSVMSIPSYAQLRNHLLGNYQMQAAIKCGPGVFPLASGEKIDSILMLVKGNKISGTETIKEKTYFADLSKEKNKALGLENTLKANSLVDQTAFVYGLPNNFLSQLSPRFYSNLNKLPKLGDLAQIRQGLATTDNGRFVRYCFDVDKDLLGKLWVPYIKGAGAQRYASNNLFVVKWGDKGEEIKEAVTKAYPYLKGKTAWVVKNEEFYFRPGLCFSFINKDGIAVRRLPAGAIFDVASSAIFANPVEEDFLLAYLNSNVVGVLVKLINQTINIQVGDLKKLPVVGLTEISKEEISKLGKEAFATKNALLNCSFSISSSKTRILSAEELAGSFEKFYESQLKLLEDIGLIQRKIDRTVLDMMENARIMDSVERKLLENFSQKQAAQPLSEKQCAYKMLNVLVSNIVSDTKGDKVVLMPLADKKSLAGTLNLSSAGLDFLEKKLEISLEKILSRKKVVHISKLAQEADRYFSFYLNDFDVCILFTSAAARACGSKLSNDNFIVAANLASNGELFNAVYTIWSTVFEKLANIIDWTSKDLAEAFNSAAF